MDEPARRHRHGRHDAPRRLRRRAGARARRWRDAYGEDGRLRAPPPPLRVQPRVPRPLRGARASCARARRPTAAWSSSSSCATTRSGSAPRPTPSSRAGPTGPHPLFREFVGAALDRAEGRTPHLFDLDAEPAAAPPPPDVTPAVPRLPPRSASATVHAGPRHPVGGRRASRRPTATSSSATSSTIRARSSVVPAARRRHGHPRAPVPGRRSTRELLEIPAGKRDVDGEPPELTAQRELAEEVGLRGRPPRARCAEFHNSPGFCDEPSHVFLATDLHDGRRTTARAPRSST